MRTSRIILGVVVLGVIGAVSFVAFRKEKPKQTGVITADVRKGTVLQKVRAVGHIEPVTQVKVSANVTGDLLQLPIKEGQSVTKGTLLAEIDRERLLAVVRQNEANLRSATAQVLLEVTQRKQAELELRRTKELFGQKLATEAERDNARSQVEIIQAREEAARQRVAQAKATVDEAKDQLAKTKLFAPIDGTIIELNKKEGERIRGSELAEDVLLTLAPLHAMQVEVEVSEQDVVKLSEGQTSEVIIDALPDDILSGRVVEIANSAVIKNKGTELETTSFTVKVAIDKIPERVRSGMSAQVAIVTKTHDDVIMVPIEAVTARLPSDLEKRADVKEEKKGSIFSRKQELAKKEEDPLAKREKPVELVFVLEDGKAEPRNVKTGISSDLDVEVLDGLDGTEEAIIGPYEALSRKLRPGSPVKVLKKLPPPKVEGTPVAGATTGG